MAEILAVCISEKKGEQKHPVDQVELKENWGIVGDAMPAIGTVRYPCWARRA